MSTHLWPTHITASACVGTLVSFTEKRKRMCWHTSGLHRTRQAHVLAQLWPRKNNGKRICWHTCSLHKTRQAHVLAHQWPTQNTASPCAGTAVTYTEHVKRVCWQNCDLHRTRQAHLLAQLWPTQNTASTPVARGAGIPVEGKHKLSVRINSKMGEDESMRVTCVRKEHATGI